jgi:hypothetical protein
MRSKFTGKLIVIMPLCFCLLMLLDWTGLYGRHFPRNMTEALLQVCVNLGWTAFFSAIGYFVFRGPSAADDPDPKHGSNRQQAEGDPHANLKR